MTAATIGTDINSFLSTAGTILGGLEPILGAIPGVGQVVTITADIAAVIPIATQVVSSIVDAITTARTGADPTEAQWAALLANRDAAIALAAPASATGSAAPAA